ncbi:hypothetical protein P691DRAFT_715303 [Macrolepiota fuliginosa MF-IS2]|uniref:DUF6533 domain-containing protein n=1 Tax=Macrolepiota fuliginosa MF-IS2 TaxID=1400762 RepID=A0A9P5WY04_9AGAR|nr:hypothetical protein P691DRAFT_715303 [Macrolepiota fuliginosa MF-IS2]
MNLASLTVLSYDWILDFSSEVILVWKPKWSLITVLYMITRYMAFVDVTVLVYQQLALNLTVKQCIIADATFGWMFTAGLSIAELLLSLRTWAVWGQDFKVGVGLLIFYAGVMVPNFVNMAFFLKSVTFIPSIPEIPGCIVTGSSNRLYINWILLMVFDIGVCMLMIIQGYRSYISGGNSQLAKVVYRDGVLYYVYLVVLSMVNLIVILRLPRQYLALLSSPMRSIHSILTCRVVLHTRGQAKQGTIVLGDGRELEGDEIIGVSTGDLGPLQFAE